MKTLFRSCIPSGKAALALLALLPFPAWNASAQQTIVSDYDSLLNAIQTSAVITNFASNLVISVATASQTIQITNNTTIDGTSNNIVFDGNHSIRLFFVRTNALLTLNNVQLLRGSSTNGGAIFNDGALIISNAIIAGNSAIGAGGVNGGNATTNSGTNGAYGSSGNNALGGAIYSLGPVSVFNSVFLTNQVQGGSGGNGGNGAAGQIGGTSGGQAGAGGAAYGGAVMTFGGTNVFVATEFISNLCVAGAGGSGGASGLGLQLNTTNGSSGQGASGGAAAGGGLYATKSLLASNCLFFNNSVTGGNSSAAQTNWDGTGYNGIPGAQAGGGGLYLSDAAPSVDIENTIFFGNVCAGGNGGTAGGLSTAGGDGGSVYGGAIFTGATAITIRNCTLATNILYPGLPASDSATNGTAGVEGATNGWQIYRDAGAARLANSILSGGATSNVVGVMDDGNNISSDASLSKSTTTTLNSRNPDLDSGLSTQGPYLGPINQQGFQTLTLALLSGSPAASIITGVPGLTFPATDERGFARGTPGSAGAFEADVITPTNTAPPTISTLPTNQQATIGQQAVFSVVATPNSSDTHTLGYQWQLNGTNLIDNANFSGATTATLTINDISAADLGFFQVVVSPSLLDSVTNPPVVYLLVKIPPTIKTQPASKLSEPVGAIVNFKVNVGGAPPFAYQWRLKTLANVVTNVVALTDENDFTNSATSNLTINPVNFPDEGSYFVVVSNFYKSVTSSVARLTVVLDKTRPTVAITSPAAGARTTNGYVAGTASDNAQVTNVYVWITNLFNGTTNVFATNAVLSTNGTTTKTWTNFGIALYPGTNIVAVRSVDYSSNVSPIVVRKFFYVSNSTFHFTQSGGGKVSYSASVARNTPPTNGALLNLGEGYTLVAKPNLDYLLTNWISTGVTNLTNIGKTLRFIMTSNLSIQANFEYSPFIRLTNSSYNGLFPTNTAAATETTAGMISHLKLGSLGAYSGKLLLDGASYPLSGTLDIFGQATNHVPRPASHGGPVSVSLAVDWTNGQIMGAVSGTNEGAGWKSALYAEQGAAPASVSHQYTLLLSSTNAAGEIPPGDGYVLMTNHLDNFTLTGALPDGATFSQSLPVGTLGNLPVFASLYGNTGFLLGWINFNSNGIPQAATNLAATNLIWIKPARPGIYPDGFTDSLSVEGSEWFADTAVTLAGGTLYISNANLYLSNQVSLDTNLVTATSGSTNSLRGTLNPKTGALKVIFGDGEGKGTLTGYAALLQDTTNAGGYFVTKTNAGSIILKP